MKLFLVHCGYYDSAVGDGIFESHTNFFVVANDFDAARARVKELPDFQAKRMHVDGLQEVQAVDGYRLQLVQDLNFGSKTILVSNKHRDLAPKPKS